MSRPLRITLYVLGGLIGLVLLIVVGVVGWLSTGSGRDFVVSQLEANVPGLKVEGAQGSVFDLTADRITLSDREGVWLTIDKPQLDWSALALAGRTVEVERLAAGRVEVARAPVPEPKPEEPDDGQPFRLPVSVNLRQLDLPRIELGPGLLGGQTAVLAARGAAEVPAGEPGGHVNLTVDRIDQNPGRAVLDATYVPGSTLALDLKVEEPAGGVVSELLDIPGRPPVTATLTGQGPLTDWTGKLTALAGDVANLSAEARIRPAQGRFTFGLDAEGNVQALLPDAAGDLVGPKLALGAGGLIIPGELIKLDGVGMTTAAGRLSGGGQYALNTDRLDLGLVFEADEASTLHQVVAEPVFREGRAELRVTGTTRLPRLDLDLALQDPAFRQYAARALTLNASAVPQDNDRNRMLVNAKAAFDRLGGDDVRLAPVAGPKTALDLQALIDANTGAVRLDRLALDSAGLDATAQGTAQDWGRGALDATAKLAAADLGTLSALAGRDLGGALTADLKATRKDGTLTARLEARGRNLATGTPAADALLGPESTLAGTVTQAGDTTRVQDLALTSPRAEVRGNATLRGNQLTADGNARLPDLAPLGQALETPMAGSGRLEARAEGPLEALNVTATLNGEGLDIAGRNLGTARLAVEAAEVPRAPRGRVDGATSLNGQPVTLGGRFSLGEQRLALSDLAATVGPNRLAGEVAADLASGTAVGRVGAELPDLGPLGELAGQRLSGTGDATIRLEAPGGRQAILVDATLANLVRRVEDQAQNLGRLTLTGRVADATGTPNLDVALRAADISSGSLRLDTVTATAKGPLTNTAIALDAAGRGARPVSLSSAGTLSRTPAGDTRVALDRLVARVQRTEFRLAQRATLTSGADRLAVEGFALVSGNARLALDADITGKTLEGRLALTRVPLAWARLLDPTLTLEGDLNGQATLAGTVADPRGDLGFRLSGFRVSPATRGGPPALGATLDGTWRNGRLALTSRATADGGGVNVTAKGDLPLILAGSAFAVELPPDRPVSGSVDGRVELSRLNDFLAGTGDRIGGGLAVDLTLGGTLADRQLAGTVQLLKARYENQQWGTIIRDIDATLAGDPQGLVVRSFTGRAGQGTVGASGAIRLDAGAGDRQVDLRLTADRALLANTDLATATAGADIAITGSFQQVLVAGRVDVREARIRIPDKLPPQVADLKIIEKNAPPPPPPPGELADNRDQPPPTVATAGSGAKDSGSTEGLGTPGGPPPSPTDPAAAPAETVIALDLDVTAPNQVYVQGRGLDSEFKAELEVKGTTAQPLVTGQVALVKGDLSVLGQTFTLARANLTFLGDGTLEPNLDVEARTQRGDITAIIDVEGRPSKPVVKLTSEPPFPEDEVLARLLFNRGAGQLSAFEALQLAQSAAQLTGLIGGGPGVLDRVKQSLGVDRLEIRGSENGEGLGTVAAGRYVGRRTYVGVEQELGTGQSKATVEYELTDNIKARGEVGTESKVGVQFEWDY